MLHLKKESLVINQPLSSGDQSKILIFTLLLAPSVLFGVGVIPALFLGFGVFMMKKNEDFSHIETAVSNTRVYISWLLMGSVLAVLYFGSTYGDPYDTIIYNGRWCNKEAFIVSIICSAIAFAYLILIKILFFNPLKSHSEWVEVNDILSSKPKPSATRSEESEVYIIKGEKLKQYSVADELIKWAKLKEDGHISEDEFKEARAKLLKK